MLKQQITEFCKSLGLDTIGFIPYRQFDELVEFYKERQKNHLYNEFEEQIIEKRINPACYFKGVRTILSIAFPYCDEELPSDVQNGFSIYTRRLDYHHVVKDYLEKICDYIRTLGGSAIGLVDSNALPERYIAYLAGVGFIGKNNMLITKKYGSFVFLGEILMDLEIDCKEQRLLANLGQYSECGTCENCFKKCPTKSINGYRTNPNICLSYITQKKVISDQEIKLLKGNVFGCDFCQEPCPYNLEIEKTPLEAFYALAYMKEDKSVYASMDNKYFKEKMSKTSCGWRGKNVIKRNALISMKYEGRPIENLRGDSSNLNDYIDRLSEMEEMSLTEG